MTVYKCMKCDAPVSVVNGVVVKTCTCTAGIIAYIKASARGVGAVL